jgi:ferredoxin-like protein FixX
MPRVIIKRKDSGLQAACDSCPMNCIKNVGDEFVIDQDACIDCGVCQSVVEDEVIVEDSNASEQDIKYNSDKANA